MIDSPLQPLNGICCDIESAVTTGVHVNRIEPSVDDNWTSIDPYTIEHSSYCRHDVAGGVPRQASELGSEIALHTA